MSTSIFAVSIGVSPAKLDYDNVLKGGFAQKTLLVSTDSPDELSINLERGGEIADWIEFGSLGENIEEFAITSNNPHILQVRILPPEDLANGNYTGTIRVVTGTLEGVDTGKGSNVKAAFLVNLRVEIVGEEIVDCIAGGMRITSFEIGEDLPLFFTIENTGNVRIDPDIEVELKDIKNEPVVDLDTNIEPLLPTLRDTFTDELNNDLEVGQYFASIKIPLCNAKQEVTFNVVEPGGISDEGELVSINAPVWAKTGEILPITATFKNLGSRNVRAKFIGDIKDAANNIVKIIDTDQITVESGEIQDFQTFFKPNYPGQYFVTGKITFNEKLTFEKITILNVNESTGNEESSSFLGMMIFLIIIIIILLIIIKQKKINLKRKRRKHKFKF